jgi:DNA invertase Pin-like site-specific DNA recombinase
MSHTMRCEGTAFGDGRARLRRSAIYARVSTAEQTPENQLSVLRVFAAARGWKVLEFVDHGVSGAKERRPGLDALLAAARARKIDIVVCVKLDRLARSVHHLVAMVTEFEALGVDLVVVDQAVDTTTPTGKLMFHVLGAVAEFERDLIRERVIAGLRRAQAQGRHLGRPRRYQVDVARAKELSKQGLSLRAVARTLNVHPSAVARALARY